MGVILIPLADPPDAFRARWARAWGDAQRALQGQDVVLRLDPAWDPEAQAANAAWFAIAFRAIVRSLRVGAFGVFGPEPDPAVRKALEEALRAPRAGLLCPRCGTFEVVEPGESPACSRCRGQAIPFRVMYIPPGGTE